MKKVLLQVGHAICFFLTVVFGAAAVHFGLSNIAATLVSVIVGTGPALGMIACRNELNGQRSQKVLIGLVIWVVIITFLCLSV